MEPTVDYKKYTWIIGTLALVGIFFASIAFGISELKTSAHPNGQQATVSVSGDGEVTAVPDIATLTVTIRESAKTVAEAQELVETKTKAAINALANLGVEEKDRKTTYYNVSPMYEQTGVIPTTYPTPRTPKIIGYEVSQSFEIKVRKIDTAGDVFGALGAANISEISGPSYTIDDPEALQAQAKEKAIAEAQKKAKETAKALGMSLGEIIGYSEDQGGYYPMYARDTMSAQYAKGGALGPEVTLPAGENKVTSRVTIVYLLK
ncbi:MAG: hypothetical protein RIQ41_72 [Candidatus Parcubacteria bacterium]|jgi:uncharacterized protein YggE